MNPFAAGALAGLIATVPMTLVMAALHRRLPPQERYPLPPRLITDEAAEKVGLDDDMGEGEKQGATAAGHFAYGAAAGALYGPLARHVPLPPACAGTLYGLAVWAGSYLGLLPAARLLTPATEHPPRRTALMIAAHIVWGSAAGVLTDLWADDEERR